MITIKKDKSVKIALDSRKLNESCIKRKAATPNMEELISKYSAKITKYGGEILMSKIDLDYAYGQAKLSREASKHCVFYNVIITTDSRKASTDYRIPHCVPRTHRQGTRNSKHLSGSMIPSALQMERKKTTDGNYEMFYLNYKKRGTEQVNENPNYSKKN